MEMPHQLEQLVVQEAAQDQEIVRLRVGSMQHWGAISTIEQFPSTTGELEERLKLAATLGIEVVRHELGRIASESPSVMHGTVVARHVLKRLIKEKTPFT
jgi:O-succinylbenzoate synthase